MHHYKTCILGSSYLSIGYALSHEGTIIIEENQVLDTQFYLPLYTFSYPTPKPRTPYGRRLLELYREGDMLSEGVWCTNAFECALSRLALENKVNILLKCRPIRIEEEKGGYVLTLQGNGGIFTIFAESIMDTRGGKRSHFTVLFVSEDESDFEALLEAFPSSRIESAFFEHRYALFIPTEALTQSADENLVKVEIYEKWKAIGIKAKILYMPPHFAVCGEGVLHDTSYPSPICALEAGCLLTKEDIL